MILLSDPYSFPTDSVLTGLAEAVPGVPVLGGLASARTVDGSGALFLDDEVRENGAVGVALEGVELLPCVSQGAAPLGRELTITAAEGNVIFELAGRPAIEMTERVIAELELTDRALVAAGLLLGIVIDSGKPEYEQGDFLVRGVLGADPSTGAVAALVFSCNGRGQEMFGACDHDATAVATELGGAPAAGFFAAGEIGPVGGRSFLHAFTATVAVFPG